MVIFLTVNDAPSGVLRSQVIDVVKLLSKENNTTVRLVSFISVRGFFKNRKWFKQNCPGAIVIPMWPKLKNWRKNRFQLKLLSRFVKFEYIIARGVFATNVALDLKASGRVKGVCYDGRGAFAAEVDEYKVIEDPTIAVAIPADEKRAVLESDYRIAVTQKLVDHWAETVGYTPGNEVIIPCTVSAEFVMPSEEEMHAAREKLRAQFGWEANDIVLVYSGSVAGWQSFEQLGRQLADWLSKSNTHKVLFLSKEDAAISELSSQFTNQIERRWLNHNDVQSHLLAGDYGIMMREQSITNKVASPTKFAEYLMAGLPVLCSPHIGDYADFVKEHNCGFLVDDQQTIDHLNLKSSDYPTRQSLAELGNRHFSKMSELIIAQYRKLYQNLTTKN